VFFYVRQTSAVQKRSFSVLARGRPVALTPGPYIVCVVILSLSSPPTHKTSVTRVRLQYDIRVECEVCLKSAFISRPQLSVDSICSSEQLCTVAK
jgi:hypothetical protein